MKFIARTFLAAAFLVAMGTELNAQITTPRVASPASEVSQTIGISTVSVNYSRPAVRGRQIWGQLVPYGWNVQGFGLGNSAPWRSGANENTVITFSHDVKFAGKDVAAGSYGLFFVINEDNSGEVVLSTDTQSWGSFFYDEASDVMKADITIRDIGHVERLTYDFINIDKNSAELVLNWEKKQFPVKVEYSVDEIVLANGAQQLKGTTGFNWQGPFSAANYSLNNNVNLEQGLVYIDRAIAQNNSFNTKRVKAGILTALEREDEAKTIIDEAIDSSTEPELNAYGYQLLGQQRNKEAIKMFKMNTDRFPESANAWDSLGEGYVTNGDNKDAIKCFKKSLSLNPPPAVKANSEKYLQQLGAL